MVDVNGECVDGAPPASSTVRLSHVTEPDRPGGPEAFRSVPSSVHDLPEGGLVELEDVHKTLESVHDRTLPHRGEDDVIEVERAFRDDSLAAPASTWSHPVRSGC